LRGRNRLFRPPRIELGDPRAWAIACFAVHCWLPSTITRTASPTARPDFREPRAIAGRAVAELELDRRVAGGGGASPPSPPPERAHRCRGAAAAVGRDAGARARRAGRCSGIQRLRARVPRRAMSSAASADAGPALTEQSPASAAARPTPPRSARASLPTSRGAGSTRHRGKRGRLFLAEGEGVADAGETARTRLDQDRDRPWG
jgi:hypothetical protein